MKKLIREISSDRKDNLTRNVSKRGNGGQFSPQKSSKKTFAIRKQNSPNFEDCSNSPRSSKAMDTFDFFHNTNKKNTPIRVSESHNKISKRKNLRKNVEKLITRKNFEEKNLKKVVNLDNTSQSNLNLTLKLNNEAKLVEFENSNQKSFKSQKSGGFYSSYDNLRIANKIQSEQNDSNSYFFKKDLKNISPLMTLNRTTTESSLHHTFDPAFLKTNSHYKSSRPNNYNSTKFSMNFLNKTSTNFIMKTPKNQTESQKMKPKSPLKEQKDEFKKQFNETIKHIENANNHKYQMKAFHHKPVGLNFCALFTNLSRHIEETGSHFSSMNPESKKFIYSKDKGYVLKNGIPLRIVFGDSRGCYLYINAMGKRFPISISCDDKTHKYEFYMNFCKEKPEVLHEKKLDKTFIRNFNTYYEKPRDKMIDELVAKRFEKESRKLEKRLDSLNKTNECLFESRLKTDVTESFSKSHRKIGLSTQSSGLKNKFLQLTNNEEKQKDPNGISRFKSNILKFLINKEKSEEKGEKSLGKSPKTKISIKKSQLTNNEEFFDTLNKPDLHTYDLYKKGNYIPGIMVPGEKVDNVDVMGTFGKLLSMKVQKGKEINSRFQALIKNPEQMKMMVKNDIDKDEIKETCYHVLIYVVPPKLYQEASFSITFDCVKPNNYVGNSKKDEDIFNLATVKGLFGNNFLNYRDEIERISAKRKIEYKSVYGKIIDNIENTQDYKKLVQTSRENFITKVDERQKNAFINMKEKYKEKIKKNIIFSQRNEIIRKKGILEAEEKAKLLELFYHKYSWLYMLRFQNVFGELKKKVHGIRLERARILRILYCIRRIQRVFRIKYPLSTRKERKLKECIFTMMLNVKLTSKIYTEDAHGAVSIFLRQAFVPFQILRHATRFLNKVSEIKKRWKKFVLIKKAFVNKINVIWNKEVLLLTQEISKNEFTHFDVKIENLRYITTSTKLEVINHLCNQQILSFMDAKYSNNRNRYGGFTTIISKYNQLKKEVEAFDVKFDKGPALDYDKMSKSQTLQKTNTLMTNPSGFSGFKNSSTQVKANNHDKDLKILNAKKNKATKMKRLQTTNLLKFSGHPCNDCIFSCTSSSEDVSVIIEEQRIYGENNFNPFYNSKQIWESTYKNDLQQQFNNAHTNAMKILNIELIIPIHEVAKRSNSFISLKKSKTIMSSISGSSRKIMNGSQGTIMNGPKDENTPDQTPRNLVRKTTAVMEKPKKKQFKRKSVFSEKQDTANVRSSEKIGFNPIDKDKPFKFLPNLDKDVFDNNLLDNIDPRTIRVQVVTLINNIFEVKDQEKSP